MYHWVQVRPSNDPTIVLEYLSVNRAKEVTTVIVALTITVSIPKGCLFHPLLIPETGRGIRTTNTRTCVCERNRSQEVEGQSYGFSEHSINAGILLRITDRYCSA